ncbi:hypothetical protein ACIBI9_47275 [Nonomuraea sp. NPDC050451]|uniref:hypothetical protein n=1 Tax=Nonomuraea sp. NPDC050451 TaxID=3364364 RepID=UPI0037A02657
MRGETFILTADGNARAERVTVLLESRWAEIADGRTAPRGNPYLRGLMSALLWAALAVLGSVMYVFGWVLFGGGA